MIAVPVFVELAEPLADQLLAREIALGN